MNSVVIKSAYNESSPLYSCLECGIRISFNEFEKYHKHCSTCDCEIQHTLKLKKKRKRKKK